MSVPAGLRVLLVEDEMLVGMLIEDLLEELGCSVIGPVTTLDTAVARARDAQCDVALLDINLGGADVYPVVEVLTRRGIAFAFLSGYQATHGHGRFEGGLSLQKPIDRAELERVLGQLDPRGREE